MNGPAGAHDDGGGVEGALVFDLAGHQYGLRLAHVGGVGEAGLLRRVPGAPREVLGLCEWHGGLVTVLDLPTLLGVGPTTGPSCLICLAPPLDHTAILVPAVVRLGWTLVGPPGPATGPTDEKSASRDDAPAPIFLDPAGLIRRVSRHEGNEP